MSIFYPRTLIDKGDSLIRFFVSATNLAGTTQIQFFQDGFSDSFPSLIINLLGPLYDSTSLAQHGFLYWRFDPNSGQIVESIHVDFKFELKQDQTYLFQIVIINAVMQVFQSSDANPANLTFVFVVTHPTIGTLSSTLGHDGFWESTLQCITKASVPRCEESSSSFPPPTPVADESWVIITIVSVVGVLVIIGVVLGLLFGYRLKKIKQPPSTTGLGEFLYQPAAPTTTPSVFAPPLLPTTTGTILTPI